MVASVHGCIPSLSTWCEMLCSSSGHDLRDSSTSCVDDLVEALTEDFRGDLDSTVDHCDCVRCEILWDELTEECRGLGGELGGFQDRSVPGSQDTDQREEGELEWIVPCTNDQDDSVRLWTELAAIQLVDERDLNRHRCRPALQILQHERDLTLDHPDLCEMDFCLRLERRQEDRGMNGWMDRCMNE